MDDGEGPVEDLKRYTESSKILKKCGTQVAFESVEIARLINLSVRVCITVLHSPDECCCWDWIS